MEEVDSVLGELKLCIVTIEFQSAAFSKRLLTLTKLLKNCRNTPEIIYIDDYLAQEDKLTPETQFDYIQKCFEKFKDHVICIPLFGTDHILKKAEFDQSLLARIMRFMLHISIVNESWLNDLELAYEGYVANLENLASTNVSAKKRKNKPLAIGKTERRFDDELAGVIPYRSCVLQKISDDLDKKHLNMLEILLNFFDVNTETKPTSPAIDGECYIVSDNTKIGSSDMENQHNGIPSILLKTVFEHIETYVAQRDVQPIFKGAQFVISTEIAKFKPLFALITSIIVKLEGKVIKDEKSVKNLTNLYSIEDSLERELNYVLPENRCSLYYVLERWGMNVNVDRVDNKYKFCHHFPFDRININEDKLASNGNLHFSLSGFFGYKKFMAQTMLKKLNINAVNYMTSSFSGLFTYVNYGDKYNFCVKKNIQIIDARFIDDIYYEAAFNLNDDFKDVKNHSFLCNSPDISNRKSKKYYKKITILKANEASCETSNTVQTSQKLDSISEVGKSASKQTVQDLEVNTAETNPTDNTTKVESKASQPKPALKRKLTVENAVASQSSQTAKRTKTTSIEELSIFDSITERVSMAGGNNTDLTYQDFGKRMKVILTGFDLKLETTNANYVYMSGIKNKRDLYKSNMYILDKMGLEISEEKHYAECDIVIINKKTSTFYESLAYDNIKYYLDISFIESLLEKVYKRKKTISLDLTKYWYKELLNMTDFIKNRKMLNGKLIFQTLNIDNLVLLNPNELDKNDPKEIVFKTHGYDSQIRIKGFDKKAFDIRDLCVNNASNLIVINNSVKSFNNVVNAFNKSSELFNYKITLVTWDTIVKMLLTMDTNYLLDKKNVLIQTP